MGVLEPWFELRSKYFRVLVDVVQKHAGESYQASTGRKRTARTGHLCIDSASVSIPPGIPLTVVPAMYTACILSITRLSTLLKGVAELWPLPVFLCSLWMLRSFVLAEHDVSTHFFRTLTDFVIETQTFSFTSLVISGLNLPFRTVVLFTASCIMNMTWTSSAVQFRFLSFLTTVRGTFFFFVFLFLMLN